MYLHEAIKKAQEESKKIALPHDEKCDGEGFRMLVIPFPNNLVVLEFYGNEMKIDEFPLAPKEMVRDDWMVVG